MKKKKTKKVIEFLEGLHEFVNRNPHLRHQTLGRSEAQIQTELRPLIIRYLELYFEKAGYKDSVGKANKSFYWEGQEGRYGRDRATLFATRNYPDFIITAPYVVAVEYKQSPSGSLVKTGIGQSIMYTLCEDFEFVYYLFDDQSDDKRIERSRKNPAETKVIEKMWRDFNVMIRFVHPR